MAHTYYFNNVSAIIADADKPRLQVLRSSLYYMGFRETEWAATTADLEEKAERLKPDLIIAALNLPGSDISTYFRKIRAGLSGVDPFTPIIAVLSEAAPATVRRGVDSGADDLVIHPWPAGYLDQRVQKLIHERKSFVVTADYVGPDRRSTQRPGRQAPKITPPNVLEAKALKRQDSETVLNAQSAARRTLGTHRARALAGLIVGLIDDLEQHHGCQERSSTDTLRRLIISADEASLQLRRAQDTTDAKTLTADIARHARLCRDAWEFGRIANLEDLNRLATRLARMFDIRRNPSSMTAERGVEEPPRLAAE
jgi:DNA-binding response OmpR family regulator